MINIRLIQDFARLMNVVGSCVLINLTKKPEIRKFTGSWYIGPLEKVERVFNIYSFSIICVFPYREF